MRFLLRVACVLAVLSATALADPFTIVLTRFGTCAVLSDCQQTFTGNDFINFSVPILGELPGGVLSVSGTATETESNGSILLSLTNLTIQGLAGGIQNPPAIPGGIAIISGSPIVAPFGVTGFASLTGQFQTNAGGGTIDYADATLRAGIGGLTLGFANAGIASGVPSPDPFSAFDSTLFNIPVDNLLIGALNFDVAAGDGIFFPGSAEVFAAPTPEPGTIFLLGPALIGAALLTRRYRAAHF